MPQRKKQQRRLPEQDAPDLPPVWDETTVDREQPRRTIRERVADEVIPREGAGPTLGNVVATAGPAAAGTGLAGRATEVARRGAQALRGGVEAIRGTRQIPGPAGMFRNPAGRIQAGRFGDATRDVARASLRDTAGAVARTPLSPTGAVAGTALGVGAAARGEQEQQGVPENAQATGGEGTAGTARPEDVASIRERLPGASEEGAGLLARMEAGETLQQSDFNEAGFAPENANVVPGGDAFTNRPSIDSLRGLSREQRGQIMSERDRRARFEGGDMTAANPGDLRRMRQAFGADAEQTMRSGLQSSDRMTETLRRNEQTPEQRQAEASGLAEARLRDSQTMRDGFMQNQDLQREDRELDIRQQEADTNRMTTMMRQNPEGQRTLDEIVNMGLPPEQVDNIAQTAFADLESAFGQQLPEELRGRMGSQLQGFMKRAAETARERFGGSATAEQLEGHMQATTDLFTAGLMASVASERSADAGSNPISFLQNAFREGGGARARGTRGIFNPDNPEETANNIMQLAEGIEAIQRGAADGSDHAVDSRSIRRGGRRDERIIIRDDNGNIIQALNYRDIPPEAQNKLLRARNQLLGQRRG